MQLPIEESLWAAFTIFAGLVGSFVGQSLFGFWGPSLAGMAILPSILGAIIVIAVVDFIPLASKTMIYSL